MFLATESRPAGADPVLTQEHLACVWREFGPTVRRLVVRALLRLPLRKVCARLQVSGIAIRRSPGLVRFDLANGNDVDDLVQDVACALTVAVRRGRLVAARPAIHRWFEQTIYFLVPERSRQSAITALTGASLSARPANDNESEEDQPNEPLIFGSGPNPEEACEANDGARARLASLTAAQREVVVLASWGWPTTDIAYHLRISVVAVRLRLMQARRRLRGVG